VGKVKEFISRTHRSANMAHPSDLLYLVLDAVIDQSLFLRNPLSQQLTEWQNLMLEKNNRFHAWNEFMGFKNIVEQLTILSEDQDDAIESWQKYSRHMQQQQFNINLNDLTDHVERCDRHLHKLSKSLDTLIQLHYSSMSHRNNEVLRILAIISCVFLPLTLITGIFGMNFVDMPILRHAHAYNYTIGAMLTIAAILLLIFRWRRWL
jgi:magnesium transporter